MTRSLIRDWNARFDQGIVKICGLRQPAQAWAAVEAGADWIGFIFAPGRRQVDPETARACIVAAKEAAAERPVLAVGVFVDADPAEMNAVAERAGLDLFQLHGNEPPEILARLDRPAVKVLKPPIGSPPAETAVVVDRFVAGPASPVAFLVDGVAEGTAGGAGVRADWAVAAALAGRHRTLLAGGLDAEQVATAIVEVGPVGVDVSSGVETEGVKDPGKIAAFVAAARAGFQERPPARTGDAVVAGRPGRS